MLFCNEIVTYDFNTTNKNWAKTVNRLINEKEMDHSPLFTLAIYDITLSGINPYDETLDDDTKRRIIAECQKNPMYTIREVIRDSNGEYIRLNVGLIYLLKCLWSRASTIFNIPKYDQYDAVMQAITQSICLCSDDYFEAGYRFSNPYVSAITVPNFTIDTFRGKTLTCDDPYEFNGLFSLMYSEDIDDSHMSYIYNAAKFNIASSHYSMGAPRLAFIRYSPDSKVNPVTIFGDMFKQLDDSMVYDTSRLSPDSIYAFSIDMIEMELNIHDVFNHFMNTYYDKSRHELYNIKTFTREYLLTSYDSLSIINKINVNKIYGELYSHYLKNIK